MDWIRQSGNDASARQARSLVSVMLATAGAAVLAAACVACSQATGASPNIVKPSVGSNQATVPSPRSVTSSAGGSRVATASPVSVTSSAGGSSGSGCSTQGIGGDSVAPVCVTPTTSPVRGIQGIPTESAPAPAQQNQQPSSPAAGLPQVTGIFPASGGAAGGDSVTISGTGFTGATEVEFGGASAQMMTVDSDTEITAVSPPGSGTVDVTVVTPNGTSAASPADQFTYQG